MAFTSAYEKPSVADDFTCDEMPGQPVPQEETANGTNSPGEAPPEAEPTNTFSAALPPLLLDMFLKRRKEQQEEEQRPSTLPRIRCFMERINPKTLFLLQEAQERMAKALAELPKQEDDLPEGDLPTPLWPDELNFPKAVQVPEEVYEHLMDADLREEIDKVACADYSTLPAHMYREHESEMTGDANPVYIAAAAAAAAEGKNAERRDSAWSPALEKERK